MNIAFAMIGSLGLSLGLSMLVWELTWLFEQESSRNYMCLMVLILWGTFWVCVIPAYRWKRNARR